MTGVVVSNSGDKSRRVVIDYKVKHPKYGKYIKRRTKLAFMMHRTSAASAISWKLLSASPRVRPRAGGL